LPLLYYYLLAAIAKKKTLLPKNIRTYIKPLFNTQVRMIASKYLEIAERSVELLPPFKENVNVFVMEDYNYQATAIREHLFMG